MANLKFKRQNKILELIRDRDIETHDELNELLKQAGFKVTQATVSRDIRELNITKVSSKNGKQKYAVLSSSNANISERFIRVFQDAVISMECAKNILVIKTLEGMAMAVAAAIDAMELVDIIGTIAGDNTLFCIVKTDKKGLEIIKKFKDIIK